MNVTFVQENSINIPTYLLYPLTNLFSAHLNVIRAMQGTNQSRPKP